MFTFRFRLKCYLQLGRFYCNPMVERGMQDKEVESQGFHNHNIRVYIEWMDFISF